MEPLLTYHPMSESDLSPLLNNVLEVSSPTTLRVDQFMVAFRMFLNQLSLNYSHLFKFKGAYLTGSALTHLIKPLEYPPEDIDFKILIETTQEVALECFALFAKTSFIQLNGQLKALEEIASSKALCAPTAQEMGFYDLMIPGFKKHLPLNLSFILAQQVELSSVFNSDSLYIECNIFPIFPLKYGLGSSSFSSFYGHSSDSLFLDKIDQKPLKNEEIATALKNLLRIDKNHSLTTEAFIAYLLRNAGPLIKDCWLQIQTEIPHDDASSPLKPLELELILLLKRNSKNASQLYERLEQIPLLGFEEEVKTLKNFSLQFGNRIFDSNEAKKYSIEPQKGHLGLQIIVFPSRESLLHYLKKGRLLIPLCIWNYPLEYGLGSRSLGQFCLYSSQGNVQEVLENIKKGVLTCQNPEAIKKWGWPRFIFALMNRFTTSDSRIKATFEQSEIKNNDEAMHKIQTFVSKKRQAYFTNFWIAFVCNSLFQSSEAASSEAWLEQLWTTLQWQHTSFPWVEFLKKEWHKYLNQSTEKSPEVKKQLRSLLPALLPLFADSFQFKQHENKLWIECEIKNQGKSFYILTPYGTQKANECSRAEILVGLMQHKTLPPRLLYGLLDSLSLSSWNKNEQHFLLEALNKAELFSRCFLKEFSTSFSEEISPFLVIEQLQSACTDIATKTCWILLKKTLRKFQGELPRIPLKNWQQLLALLSALPPPEPIQADSGRILISETILKGLIASLSEKQTPEKLCKELNQESALFWQIFEKLLEHSSISLQDKPFTKEFLPLYFLLTLHAPLQASDIITALYTLPLNFEATSCMQKLVLSIPSYQKKIIYTLVDKEAYQTAIDLLEILEGHRPLFYRLLEEKSDKAEELIRTQLKKENCPQSFLWELYVTLAPNEALKALLEKDFLFNESSFLYLKNQAELSLQKRAVDILQLRIEKPDVPLHLYYLFSLLADSIGAETLQRYASSFAAHFNKLIQAPQLQKMVACYTPLLDDPTLKQLAEKVALVDSLLEPFYEAVSLEQKRAITFHLLSSSKLPHSKLPQSSLWLLLKAACQLSPASGKQAETTLLKIRNYLDYLPAKMQTALCEEKTNLLYLVAKTVLDQSEETLLTQPLFAEISEKLISLLCSTKLEPSELSSEKMHELFTLVHAKRIQNKKSGNLQFEALALSSLMQSKKISEKKRVLTLIHAFSEMVARVSKERFLLNERMLRTSFSSAYQLIQKGLILEEDLMSFALSFTSLFSLLPLKSQIELAETKTAGVKLLLKQLFALQDREESAWISFGEICNKLCRANLLDQKLFQEMVESFPLRPAAITQETFMLHALFLLYQVYQEDTSLQPSKIETAFIPDLFSSFCTLLPYETALNAVIGLLSCASNKKPPKHPFVADLISRISACYKRRESGVYTDFFMSPYFQGPIPWDLFLATLMDSAKIDDWAKTPEENINDFALVFCDVVERQFDLSPYKERGSIAFIGLLAIYSRLLESVSFVPLAPNLIQDILLSPGSYFAEAKQKISIAAVLTRIRLMLMQKRCLNIDSECLKLMKLDSCFETARRSFFTPSEFEKISKGIFPF